jgi:uncharacterized membrane protein YkvA (DUF1232 family)
MDKIDDFRGEQIEANSGHYETYQNNASDTSMILPEKTRNTRNRPTDLRKIWDYFELLFSMLSDSYNRKYPVPMKSVLMGSFALLYLISPVDISPDFFPLIGFVDDIALLAFAASLIKDDLEKYSAWKMSSNNDFI